MAAINRATVAFALSAHEKNDPKRRVEQLNPHVQEAREAIISATGTALLLGEKELADAFRERSDRDFKLASYMYANLGRPFDANELDREITEARQGTQKTLELLAESYKRVSA
jgi:hypothetical protein